MKDRNGIHDHDQFHELGALATSGALTPSQWDELKAHLNICPECRHIYYQYVVLAFEGMPYLASQQNRDGGFRNFNSDAARRRLLARVQGMEHQGRLDRVRESHSASPAFLDWQAWNGSLTSAVLVALFLITTGTVAYQVGYRMLPGKETIRNSSEDHIQKPANSVIALPTRREPKRAQLEDELSQRKIELLSLKSKIRNLENLANSFRAASAETTEEFRSVSQERDALINQLHATEQAHRMVLSELDILRSENEKKSLEIASRESKINELSMINRDQDRRLKDEESYLASDRDIREMMGAQKLYIADVFDVDSRSRTRKTFGRIFYTNGKSLLFYAFDLDAQPDLKNASAFQAWGRTEAGEGRPLNLGIFYLDSETNRRWILRFDDPKRLAEIDAVFVTVEPRGGSKKPTGKPFLYASLRQQANHP
jgi:hypothetical protein